MCRSFRSTAHGRLEINYEYIRSRPFMVHSGEMHNNYFLKENHKVLSGHRAYDVMIHPAPESRSDIFWVYFLPINETSFFFLVFY